MNWKQGIFLLILIIIFFAILKISSYQYFSLHDKGKKTNSENSQHDEMNLLDYYTSQGVMTDPGKYTYLYNGLPSEVSELRDVVQGVLIHIFHYQRYGIELSEERNAEVNIRKVEDMLARIIELDDRPIIFKREPMKRLVANCRGYSVFMTSLLRYKGISARARCGFETYFIPGKCSDHWICEYWNQKESRWIQIDTQIDSLQKQAFNFEFDPLDLPAGKFLTAGEVWKLCGDGKIDPDLCGIGDLKGLWFVRGNVIRDFMALNKFEVLPWDCNELMTSEKKLNQEEMDLLDQVAELTTAGDSSFSEIRTLYESNSALRMGKDWKP